ncbi:MAG: isoprenylcysteine carboxylmethyltransferase family protein [Coriobacteriia bacterium]|nr:isoprenylcysteine carboxylmethyltransferase family protein [Coriobacteriia bacterium]
MNPMSPQSATTLVTTGIYRFTRNPMYLADLLFLLSWGTYLGSPVALLGAPAFVLYIDRFQISVEERVMAELFGQQYEEYRALVRRWL